MQQYLIGIAIRTMMENGVDSDNNTTHSPQMIRGLNRGTLLFLNDMLEGVPLTQAER